MPEHVKLPDPPTCPEMEMRLFGCMALDPSTIDRVRLVVSPHDFNDRQLGEACEATITLYDAGSKIFDPAVLLTELRRMKISPEIANGGFIARASNVVASNATYYASEVRRCADLRRQQQAAVSLLERTGRADSDPADNARWLDGLVATMHEARGAPTKTLGDVAMQAVDSLDRESQETAAPGVMLGIESLDSRVGAFMPGELVILAARPGCGKTSFAMQIATHSANRGRPVLFASLEMSARELSQRHLCSVTGINGKYLRRNQATESMLATLRDAANDLSSVPCNVWDPPSATLAQIRAVAKMQHAATPLRLLVVDYIGLVRPDDWRIPRYEQVSRISAGLKSLAKELRVPVLALCQLNREAEKSEPMLSHLRESGAIEQDADAVLFLHKEGEQANGNGLDVQLIVAKHRHGPTGCVKLRWLPETTRFDDSGQGVGF